MKKGAQITIFIVLGIVLLLTFGLLLHTSNHLKTRQLEPEISEITSFDIGPIKAYVSSCLDTSLKEGVLYTGLIENDLNNYLTNYIEGCVNLEIFENQGLRIEEGVIESDVQITDRMVLVDLDYPLSISKKQQSAKLDRFSSSLKLIESSQLIPIGTQITTDDESLQLNIPSNINALLDNNLVSDVSIQIVNSNGDPNIFSPIIYNLQPSEVTFEPPLTLELRYEDSNLPDGFDENNLRILTRQNSSYEWRPMLTNVDVITNTLTADISHFSDVGIGSVENEECYEELTNIEVTDEGHLVPEIDTLEFHKQLSNLPQINDLEVTDKKSGEYVFALQNVAPASFEGPGYVIKCNDMECKTLINMETCDYFQGLQKMRSYNGVIYITHADTRGDIPPPVLALNDDATFSELSRNGKLRRVISELSDQQYVFNIPDSKKGVDFVKFKDSAYYLHAPQGIGKGPGCSFQPQGKDIYCMGDTCMAEKFTGSSMAVWNDKLLIAQDNKIIHYDGQNPHRAFDISFDKIFDQRKLNLGVSGTFKGNLYAVKGNRLYKSSDGVNFEKVIFFQDFTCQKDAIGKYIADIEVLNSRIYVSVIEGIQTSFNWEEEKDIWDEIKGFITGDDCQLLHQSGYMETVRNFLIYSSNDGETWEPFFSHSSGIARVEGAGAFPLTSLKGNLYAGIVDPENSGGRNTLLKGDSSLYKSTFKKEGIVISKPYQLGNFSSATLSWVTDNSVDSEIVFQIKTAKSRDQLNSIEFTGPDGTENTYFINTDTIFNSNNEGDNWIQFKLKIKINNEKNIPMIKEVNIKRNDIDDAQHQICITKYS